MNDRNELDWQFKGFPTVDEGLTPAAFAASRPGLFDTGFHWPMMVIKRRALDHNVATLANYCASRGVDLAPHVKTTMSPKIWRRQLAAGAWGLTVATPNQVRVLRADGVSRIFLANELVDANFIEWLADQLATDDTFDFYCYVDSVDGVDILGAATSGRGGRPLRVLVELGHEDGRTGCRTDADAFAVARAVRQHPSLSLVGVAGYEGGIGRGRSAATVGAVRAYVRRVRRLLESLDRDELLDEEVGEHVVSCGGSLFFDLVADELTGQWETPCQMRVVLRSGSYVTHDSAMYDVLSPLASAPLEHRLQPAIEVWCQVLSRPEPTLALLGVGKRDISFDEGLPVVLATRPRGGQAVQPQTGFVVTQLNDQHAFVSVSRDASLAVGDLVCLGVSHPCTVHDKWQLVPLVDDEYRVVDTIRSYF